jgi:hypothetical protein
MGGQMERFPKLVILLFLILLGLDLIILIDRTICLGNTKISEEMLKEILPRLRGVRFATMKDLFEHKVLFENDDNIEGIGCSLYLEGDFNKDGVKEVAICGVYFDGTVQKEKPFLLILSEHKKIGYRKEFFKEFSHFFVICKETELDNYEKNQVLAIGFRAYTDLGGRIFYEGGKYIYRDYIPPGSDK